MKILITGATGMVGRNVLENAAFREHELLIPKRSDLNLLQFEKVLEYFRANQPDFVIHLAGRVGGIQANIAQPIAFMVENIDIGRNVILAAYQSGVKKLINAGSSCMYPRDVVNPLREEMILTGELEPTNEGYAIAKIMSQRLCRYIQKENSDFQYKTLIPSNLYGKFDHFDPKTSHLVPAILVKVHQAVQEKRDSVEIWGTGESRREFLYAEDFVDCLARCLTHYESLPEIMNVGNGIDYSVNDYYEAAAKIAGFKGKFTHDLTKPVGMKQKLVSTARANAWGWKSKTSLNEGLQKTYQYYTNLIRNER